MVQRDLNQFDLESPKEKRYKAVTPTAVDSPYSKTYLQTPSLISSQS